MSKESCTRVLIESAACAHSDFELVYSDNYGFVPDTVSVDGEELDVYFLGVDEPVKSFTGNRDIEFL